MAFGKSRAKRGLDWLSLALFLSLLIIGWLMLFASFYDEAKPIELFSFRSEIGRQTIWTGLSLIAFFSMLVIDWKFWFSTSYFIYIAAILLLILVLIFGSEEKGAQSWFKFFGFSFQPSEFAKFATCLAMASYLSLFNTNFKDFKALAISMSIMAAPAILILLQPDAGSALIFAGFFVVLYRKGMNILFFLIGFSLIAIFIMSLVYSPKIVLLIVLLGINSLLIYNYRTKNKYFLIGIPVMIGLSFIGSKIGFEWYIILVNVLLFGVMGALQFLSRKFKSAPLLALILVLSAAFSFGSKLAFDNLLEPHQKDRIHAWLKPSLTDNSGSSYNIYQSKIAIGSGGFQGKGFLQGFLTKGNFVPEQSTDFIFSIVGEEQGFIGVLGIIVIYFFLLIRLSIIAERAKNDFIRYFVYGVAGILFVHVFINIGMTMGIMPVIGIPLPFLSKGGTALLVFSVMMGIVIRMDLERYR